METVKGEKQIALEKMESAMKVLAVACRNSSAAKEATEEASKTVQQAEYNFEQASRQWRLTIVEEMEDD